MMLAKTFSAMIVISVVCAVYTGNCERMSIEFAASLTNAVNLCISLLGMMCFWSGLMNVFRTIGVLELISKSLFPLLRLVYGKSIMDEKKLQNLSASMAANFLGLGNAALPLGIQTVKSFEENNKSGIARDETIMFAVLNTVPFQLIPSTLIALRSKYMSNNPFDVVPLIWICSIIIIAFAVIVCKILAKICGGKLQ